MMIPTRAGRVLRCGLILAAAACGSGGAQSTDHPADFSDPQPVAIAGYSGDAMEPFLSPDGGTLFFNDSNAPGHDTNLFYATRIDDRHFQFQGPIAGANSGALDAVASMDLQGRFYFISTRSYSQTLATIYTGRYAGGALSNLALVTGVSLNQPGAVNFDAGISPDGSTLYFVDGVFDGGSVPSAANLAIAERQPDGSFLRRTDGTSLLRNVNSSALEYAPCISADGLELFFTRASGGTTAIYRAARSSVDQPFGPPHRVTAASGDSVEAPSLSPDGTVLYYHARSGGVYGIYRITR